MPTEFAEGRGELRCKSAPVALEGVDALLGDAQARQLPAQPHHGIPRPARVQPSKPVS